MCLTLFYLAETVGFEPTVQTHRPDYGLANRCNWPLCHVSIRDAVFRLTKSVCPAPWLPLVMGYSASLSVVSQLLSVCIPSGWRMGATQLRLNVLAGVVGFEPTYLPSEGSFLEF